MARWRITKPDGSDPAVVDPRRSKFEVVTVE
jgi:hypothetical protein